MLSFKSGRPIAIIEGGKLNNQIINITDDDNENIIDNDPLDMLDDVLYGLDIKRLSRVKIKELINILKNKKTSLALIDDNELLKKIIDRSKEQSKKELKIYDEGQINVLPYFNGTDRCYISGQTMCGKSYWCLKYAKLYEKVHKKNKIYLFTDNTDDDTYDSIKNITKFKLDNKLLELEEPIEPSKFEDSLCIFDDIDSIQDKKILIYVNNLRDSIVKKGRHNNISCLCTNHLNTDYKNTRILLSQSNLITVYCRSGSSDGIKYLLKKYGGIDKKVREKILKLPSRWVSISLNHPQYVIYEKGIFVI